MAVVCFEKFSLGRTAATPPRPRPAIRQLPAHAMPILKWFPPQGPPRTFVLYKPVTTVGRALGNDVAVAGEGVAETHAQILFDGRDFNLEEVDKQAEILINGKKKRRARLVHGDRLTLGDVELAFSMFDEPQKRRGTRRRDGDRATVSETQLDVTDQQLAGLRKLFEFSEKLMTMKDVDELLEAMLDDVIEVTGAEKGLILLIDDAFTTRASPSARSAAEVRGVGDHAATRASGARIRAVAQRAARGDHRRERRHLATASCAR